jgi:4-amino-4-deoxy-L-arabinose transferase-like glycosyltransferase
MQTVVGRIWPWLLAAYFALHLVLRVALGGALETDEAEMLLLTTGWHWGYGPQLPLYSWVQMAAFTLLGHSVLALSLVKNLMLCATYALLFMSFRHSMPQRFALLATLSFALLPDVFWEAQRATTHSVALILMVAATIWAAARLVQRPGWPSFVIFGVVMGLGGLSKFNYWLVPLALLLAAATMPTLRKRFWTRGMLLSVLVAALILAGPVWWMIQNPEIAFASTYKLSEKLVSGLPVLGVLRDIVTGLVAGLGFVILVSLGLRALRRDTQDDVSAQGLEFLTLLMRAAWFALFSFALAAVLAGATSITSRWMLGVFLLAAPPLLFAAVRGRAVASGRVLAGLVTCLALLTLVGMVASRHFGAARGAVDFARLDVALAVMAPQDHQILADFYLGGNLVYSHPDWRIGAFLPLQPLPAVGDTVLVISRDATSLRTELARAGWPDADRITVLDQTVVDLPYARAPGQYLRVWITRVTRAP